MARPMVDPFATFVDSTLRSLLSRLVGQMDMWNAAMESRAYDLAVEQG